MTVLGITVGRGRAGCACAACWSGLPRGGSGVEKCSADLASPRRCRCDFFPFLTVSGWTRTLSIATEVTSARVTSVRSIAALPMHHDRFVLGVLILAAERPDAFDATVLANAADLAALAAGAWSAVVREEQLRRALNSRDDIGQAKGILMERFSITADGAFALLRQLSQESNTPPCSTLPNTSSSPSLTVTCRPKQTVSQHVSKIAVGAPAKRAGPGETSLMAHGLNHQGLRGSLRVATTTPPVWGGTTHKHR